MSTLPETIASLPSRGQCWGWDWTLLSIRGASDLLTFLAFAIIAMVSYYIYRNGRLSQLRYFYPSLWRLGALFVGLNGLSDLDDAAEMVIGGNLYWLTTTVNIALAVVSMMFAVQFYKVREEIALLGRVLSKVHEHSEHTFAESTTIDTLKGDPA